MNLKLEFPRLLLSPRRKFEPTPWRYSVNISLTKLLGLRMNILLLSLYIDVFGFGKVNICEFVLSLTGLRCISKFKIILLNC